MAEWLIKQLSWYEDREAIQDNLREEYQDRVSLQGKLLVWLWYWLHVLRSFLPFMGFELMWRFGMFKNYLKIALRYMNRQKIYAGINILGLAIGMAGAMFILFWVRDELSYDRFHEKADRIYRAYQVFHYDDYHLEQTQTPGILATKLKEECPEAELVTRVRG